jgi:hypothetical protein
MDEAGAGLGLDADYHSAGSDSVVSCVSNPEEILEEEDQENTIPPSPSDILSPLVSTKISLPKRKPKTSWVWKHFKPSSTNKDYAFCTLCSLEIFYGSSRSTGMLERHIQRKHPKAHSDILKSHVAEKNHTVAEDGATELTQSSISEFVAACPKFESYLLRWMIKTYQPLRCCESNEFRMMCKSLNKRSPIIGRERLNQLLKSQYHELQSKLIVIFKGQFLL